MPGQDEILEKVIEIIRDSMYVESEITANSHLIDDLHAESMDVVCIGMELEEAFGVTIEQAQAEKLQTVQLIVDFVRESMAQAESAGSAVAETANIEA